MRPSCQVLYDPWSRSSLPCTHNRMGSPSSFSQFMKESVLLTGTECEEKDLQPPSIMLRPRRPIILYSEPEKTQTNPTQFSTRGTRDLGHCLRRDRTDTDSYPTLLFKSPPFLLRARRRPAGHRHGAIGRETSAPSPASLPAPRDRAPKLGIAKLNSIANSKKNIWIQKCAF